MAQAPYLCQFVEDIDRSACFYLSLECFIRKLAALYIKSDLETTLSCLATYRGISDNHHTRPQSKRIGLVSIKTFLWASSSPGLSTVTVFETQKGEPLSWELKEQQRKIIS